MVVIVPAAALVVVLSGSRFRLAAALFAAPHLADAADPMVVAVS